MSRPSYFFGGSSGSPNKNLLINGNFDVWQRGTSQTTHGYGSADRWFFGSAGSTKTVSQQSFDVGQTDVPNNPTHYVRTINTTDSSTNDNNIIFQRIEDVTKTSGQTLIYSFWAKADTTKDISIEFQQYIGNAITDTGIGVKKFTLSANWQKYSGTVVMPSLFGRTIGTGSFTGLAIWLSGGSNYDYRTNSLGNQSGTFDIAQVQLEYGGESTDFEHRTYGEELTLCQRYYQLIGNASSAIPLPSAIDNSSILRYGYVAFPTDMRSSPTVTIGNFTGTTTITIGTTTTNSVRLTASAASVAHGILVGAVRLDAEL